MLVAILRERESYYILLFWLAIGVISSTLAMVLIPLHLLALSQKYGIPYVSIIGFWFVLILSDSYQPPLDFAKTTKALVILVITLIGYRKGLLNQRWTSFYRPFIPFFIISLYCLTQSPYLSISIQKTISYGLLLFIIPAYSNYLMRHGKERFLMHLIILGAIVLGLGILLRFIYPQFVLFMGVRFSGLFGNPNGLGMFTFLFLILFTTIREHHQYLLTRNQTYLVYMLIALSLYWSGSRGGIFASLLFIIGLYLFKTSRAIGAITMLLMLIAYQIVMNNLEAIILSLNLQDYFRLETLESGSGRNIAFDFAWKHIQYNYWLGLGFGYAEELMQANQDYFVTLGHVGNVHNSYLTMWLDTGLIGLLAFAYGWINNFWKAYKNSIVAGAAFFAVLFNTNVESWLAGSLNPFTIQLVIILTLLINPEFYKQETSNAA